MTQTTTQKYYKTRKLLEKLAERAGREDLGEGLSASRCPRGKTILQRFLYHNQVGIYDSYDLGRVMDERTRQGKNQ